MLPALTQSPLAANLDGLGERNTDVRRKIEAAGPAHGLVFEETPANATSGSYRGARLASRRDRGAEAKRLIDTLDLVEHSAFVVFGFGLGYHVQTLAERLRGDGLIIVYEPDVELLRAVLERIDHSAWIKDALLIIVTDADDGTALTRTLSGAEAILGQGVAMVRHPASRERLGQLAGRFSTTLAETMAIVRITLMTTLVRASDTVGNLVGNLNTYVGGPGITDLAGAARGRLGVVVSAGPSLHRNLHALAAPGVRDRCVIIAVQTTLKPLLDAGVRPHFVTALDYHEISRRFYEGVAADQVEDVTLVADPKAHPSILEAFPGAVRCCRSAYLDDLLGDVAVPMGELPAGATVAHLALYLARYLGCDPIALIGQDLGFTDGLYYAPGTAIHDVWAPELNPFNTLDTMEWQRIARHRTHLKRATDVHGRPILTDDQMLAYRRHFERDFADCEREGVTIIDATEGGVPKRHTKAMPLAAVLDAYARTPLPPLPMPRRDRDQSRQAAALTRLGRVRSTITELRQLSQRSRTVLRRMLDDQRDPGRMTTHFRKIESLRRRVDDLPDAFRLVNQLNQVGVFKRRRADRVLNMQPELSAIDRQRAQIERDIVNVEWLADAAHELAMVLDGAQRRLKGETVPFRRAREPMTVTSAPTARRVGALVPVDPTRSGLGIERSLLEPFGHSTVLQTTLERLGAVRGLDCIVLLMPRDCRLDEAIERSRIGRPLEIARLDGSPFAAEQSAVAAARHWADTSWRGGIAGMSVYDEVLCPAVMHDAMIERGLDAALLVGPDWPLIDPSETTGCGAVIKRYLEHPDHLRMVFTQAPPGFCGCVISESLMRAFRERTRLATIGGQLTHHPHMPQTDPIAKDTNVQIAPELRNPRIRATADSPRQCRRLRAALEGCDPTTMTAADVATAIARGDEREVDSNPRHLVLELTPRASHDGVLAPPAIDRPDLDVALARHVVRAAAADGDLVLTLAGVGDPLVHPRFDDVMRAARDAGARALHVRTSLLAEPDVIDRLIAAEPDVVSVELPADSPDTYARMMGVDRYHDVVTAIQRILQQRRHLAGPEGTPGLELPWIVPRFPRRRETYGELESFYDRWQHLLGTAVIEPASPGGQGETDTLIQIATHASVARHEMRRRMTILSDGSVPVDESDLAGETCVGSVADHPLTELWSRLLAARRTAPRPLRLHHP